MMHHVKSSSCLFLLTDTGCLRYFSKEKSEFARIRVLIGVKFYD